MRSGPQNSLQEPGAKNCQNGQLSLALVPRIATFASVGEGYDPTSGVSKLSVGAL